MSSTSDTDADHVHEISSRKILIGITGSVATIKLPVILKRLEESPTLYSVKIISTGNAFKFIKKDEILYRGQVIDILNDDDEWKDWNEEKQVLHVQLRNWADVFLVAPLDANTMAKFAFGLCDNLISCTFRAWNRLEKPIIICPAMNTAMWESPVTSQHLSLLLNNHHLVSRNNPDFLYPVRGIEDRFHIPNAGLYLESQIKTPTLSLSSEKCIVSFPIVLIPPVAKKLACGDIGMGGMASPEDIVEVVQECFSQKGHEDLGSD